MRDEGLSEASCKIEIEFVAAERFLKETIREI